VSCVRKVAGAGSCNFPIEEITGAENVKFIAKFAQNRGFSVPNFAVLEENFLTRRKFSDSPKFRGGGAIAPLLPPRHDATADNML